MLPLVLRVLPLIAAQTQDSGSNASLRIRLPDAFSAAIEVPIALAEGHPIRRP